MGQCHVEVQKNRFFSVFGFLITSYKKISFSNNQFRFGFGFSESVFFGYKCSESVFFGYKFSESVFFGFLPVRFFRLKMFGFGFFIGCLPVRFFRFIFFRNFTKSFEHLFNKIVNYQTYN